MTTGRPRREPGPRAIRRSLPATSAPPGPPAPARLRRALLAWYDKEARDLPWRRRRNPWRVWVAEVMLQQTRVEAVREPYGRFLARFPTVAALARAEEAEVLAAWSGLGYYRRARLLHAGAKVVVHEHAGRLPRERDRLRRIPGIGEYTSGAIASIAFGLRQAAVDANVARVLARVLGLRGVADARARARVADFAAAVVDCDRPGDVNEALMDLGAGPCGARRTCCTTCPLRRACAASRSGRPTDYGGARPKKAPRTVNLACAVLRAGDSVLFVRRADAEALLAGMWELPSVEVGEGDDPAAVLSGEVHRRTGCTVQLEGPVARVRHEIVGRRIRAEVWTGRVRPPRRGGVRMLRDVEMGSVAIPALPVKILRTLSKAAPPRSRAARGAA